MRNEKIETVIQAFQLNDIYEVWKQEDGSYEAYPVRFAGLMCNEDSDGNKEYLVKLFEYYGDCRDDEFFPIITGRNSDSFMGYFDKSRLDPDEVKFPYIKMKDVLKMIEDEKKITKSAEVSANKNDRELLGSSIENAKNQPSSNNHRH